MNRDSITQAISKWSTRRSERRVVVRAQCMTAYPRGRQRARSCARRADVAGVNVAGSMERLDENGTAPRVTNSGIGGPRRRVESARHGRIGSAISAHGSAASLVRRYSGSIFTSVRLSVRPSTCPLARSLKTSDEMSTHHRGAIHTHTHAQVRVRARTHVCYTRVPRARRRGETAHERHPRNDRVDARGAASPIAAARPGVT